LGVMILDGAGNVTCSETVQLPGSNLVSNCAGKYSVGADGCGVIEVIYDIQLPVEPLAETTPQISTARFKFYAANGGKLLKGIRTENGVFVIANFDKN
jgi:hypothetical protein